MLSLLFYLSQAKQLEMQEIGEPEGQAERTRPTRRIWSARDSGQTRQEASDVTLGSGPQKRQNQITIRRERVQG